MSLFNKPKKNIRRRPIGEHDPDEEIDNSMEVVDEEKNVQETVVIKPKRKEKDKKVPSSGGLLSFGEELNEGDDGEVFQVKKSSQSKKIMKLMDKERKKKKETKKDDTNAPNSQTNEDDLVIIVKNSQMNAISLQPPPPPPIQKEPRILNGRAAEFAELEEFNDSDSENTHHKFSRPDHVKSVLESGKIPDAATIHAARKKRQLAREMGNDFVPIDDGIKYESSNSRLIRDDENDISDEENQDRLTMHVNLNNQERERRREAFLAAQDHPTSDGDSDKAEDDEWESQQIRKGVTGAQLVSHQTMDTLPAILPPVTTILQAAPVPTTPGVLTQEALCTIKNEPPPQPDAVLEKLRSRLLELRESAKDQRERQNKVTRERVSACEEREKLEKAAPALAQRFRFYQELRGYVTDLVECLDEKMPVITSLEQRVNALLKRRCDELQSRRRQDVRDQNDEIAALAKIGGAAAAMARRGKEEEEAHLRRMAEREGRRTRRRKARENKSGVGTSAPRHVEGMSSDEEMTELELTSYRNQTQVIEQDARLVFEDVLEDFSSLRGVLKRFETWRTTESGAYRDAYVSLCLPKVVAPLIRLKLLLWNPLQENSVDVERAKWFDVLLLYGLIDKETEETLRSDPDLELLPSVIEKVVLPKLKDLVEAGWDPLSTAQTVRLVTLLNKYTHDYPTFTTRSKPLEALINIVVEKMRDTVENDIFIPIHTSKQVSAEARAFFQRQFGCAVKLLRNLLAWQGIVSDQCLQDLAINALLNRYLIAALRFCKPLDAVAKCNMIVMTFPRSWLQKDSAILSHLQLFAQAMKGIAQSLDISSQPGRDSMDVITQLLQPLQLAASS